jgi:WD40 repeat protein
VDGIVKIWDVTGGRECAAWTKHTGPILGLAVTMDGRKLVSTGESAEAFLWDSTTGHATALRGHLFQVYAAATSRTGIVATIGRDTYLKLWDEHTGQELTNLMKTRAKSVTFTPEGGRVLIGNESGQIVSFQVPDAIPPVRYPLRANAAALIPRPSGGIVIAEATGDVTVWNPTGSEPAIRIPASVDRADPNGAAPPVA